MSIKIKDINYHRHHRNMDILKCDYFLFYKKLNYKFIFFAKKLAVFNSLPT